MQTLMIGSLPKSLVILVVGALGLTACDDNSSTNKSKSSSSCISSLGPDFVRAFSQNRFAEPLDVREGDLKLTPTREPFDIPC